MPAIEKSRLLWDNSGHLLISSPEPWPRRVTLQMKQATNTALSADRAPSQAATAAIHFLLSETKSGRFTFCARQVIVIVGSSVLVSSVLFLNIFYCTCDISLPGGERRSTQRISHTPSTAFRHLPPNSGRFSYATEGALHTPTTAFRHLPPNSARFSYATEEALYLRAAVQRRGQHLPKGSGTNMTVEAT